MRKVIVSLVLIAVLFVVTAAPLMERVEAHDELKLKVAVLPILDVLPAFVAEQAGYFADAGLEVELIPVSSALERDQLLMASAIDGMLADLQSIAIFNQDEPFLQIVAQARRAYEDAPMFRVLAAPRSNITLPAEAANFEIAISENTIIHYITQRMMEDAGVSAADLKFRPEPNIPVRFQLLMEGQIKVATLPDPLAQAAVVAGAILIADDTALVEQEFSQSILAFRVSAIEEHPEAIEAFLAAWMRAAEDINAAPDAYRDLWLEKTNVPDSVKDSYVLPPFPVYAITQELAWDDTVAWMEALDIVDSAASYEDSVNNSFLEAIAPVDGAPDTALGEQLFASLGCAGCHSLDGTPGAGPSLAGLASRAGETVDGQSAGDYLRLALVDPGVFVAEGFAPIMPAYDTLSDDDLDALVGYLMTLD